MRIRTSDDRVWYRDPPEPEEFAAHRQWGIPEPPEAIEEPGDPRRVPHAWKVRWMVLSADNAQAAHPHRFLECPRVSACVGRALERDWDDFTCGKCRFRDRDYPLPTREELDADDD